MAIGCHDRQPLSSLAFGRAWHILPKLFSVKGFVTRKDAALCFGSAAAAIGDTVIAVIVADKKHAGNNGAQLIFDINGLPKEGLIIETVSGPIADGRRKNA